MREHKFYVIAYVECPECLGSHRTVIKGRVVVCDRCNEQGEVEERVPLVEALNELGR